MVVVLEDTTGAEDATRTAKRIARTFEEPFVFSVTGREVVADPSIGIDFGRGSPGESESGDLLRSADAAMHEARRRGKARHTVYEESMDTRATERLQLESAFWGPSSAKSLRCINSPRCRSRAARMA